ncbi:hypothetical protein HMPREF1548_03045 [Clostridium sp. KLE 1755]|nr:hypothetical protein HMPREF1548_03045 [Clostridium sp. KLE 1755]
MAMRGRIFLFTTYVFYASENGIWEKKKWRKKQGNRALTK